MFYYFPKYDDSTYFVQFYCIFIQNSLIRNVVLLAQKPLSEHKCLDNGPYFNSMTKYSANGGSGEIPVRHRFSPILPVWCTC